MSYTLTWGTVTLPDAKIDGVSVRKINIGSETRTLDGTLRSDVIATKHEISIEWQYRTAAEWDTIQSAFSSYYTTATNLVIPSGGTYSVMATGQNALSFQEHQFGTTTRISATLVAQEV